MIHQHTKFGYKRLSCQTILPSSEDTVQANTQWSSEPSLWHDHEDSNLFTRHSCLWCLHTCLLQNYIFWNQNLDLAWFWGTQHAANVPPPPPPPPFMKSLQLSDFTHKIMVCTANLTITSVTFFIKMTLKLWKDNSHDFFFFLTFGSIHYYSEVVGRCPISRFRNTLLLT